MENSPCDVAGGGIQSEKPVLQDIKSFYKVQDTNPWRGLQISLILPILPEKHSYMAVRRTGLKPHL